MAWWTMLHALVITLLATPTGQEYPDGHGGKVFFPLGDVSFADVVIATDPGKPACKKQDAVDPAAALSVPNYKKGKSDGSYTLGCGGSLVVRFTDNALV